MMRCSNQPCNKMQGRAGQSRPLGLTGMRAATCRAGGVEHTCFSHNSVAFLCSETDYFFLTVLVLYMIKHMIIIGNDNSRIW